jgi:hypothetical protein
MTAMTRHVLKLTVFVSTLSAFGIVAGQQVPEATQVLQQIAGAAESLRGYGPAEPAEQKTIQEQSTRISKNADLLRNLLQKRQVSNSFRRTLQQDASALDRLKEKKPPARTVVVTTTGVADDLDAKARYVGAPIWGAQVADAPVRARTKSGNREEPGYRVWYVIRGVADDPNEFSPFPRLSTPTDHDLPPGAYLMWTRRPEGGPEGVKTPVDVGKPGQPQTEVDLPVPSGGK